MVESNCKASVRGIVPETKEVTFKVSFWLNVVWSICEWALRRLNNIPAPFLPNSFQSRSRSCATTATQVLCNSEATVLPFLCRLQAMPAALAYQSSTSHTFPIPVPFLHPYRCTHHAQPTQCNGPLILDVFGPMQGLRCCCMRFSLHGMAGNRWKQEVSLSFE
jgi:hypothetical protein